MINAITVTNNLNESLRVDLRRPEQSGFLFYNISGLGPVQANVNISEVANSDISLFNSARLSTRNIVIPVIFMWDNDEKQTIEELRRKTYKYFPLKKLVKLLIETDSRVCETTGYVEHNEPNIFSDRENTTVSIVCPDPFLYDYKKKIRVVFGDSVASFEFPFSNESLTDPLIELSTTNTVDILNMKYKGDADTGIKISISVPGDISQYGKIEIANNTTSEIFKIDCAKAGSIVGSNHNGSIEVTTERGNKHVYYRTTDNRSINILNAIDRDSDWVRIVPGNNMMRYFATDHIKKLFVEISSKILYDGI